jgi:hypothetical protein
MVGWTYLAWGVAGLASVYGLHRLALALEERGLIYYVHKKPRGSGGSCLVALQKAIEPQSQHVLIVREEKRSHGEEDVPGRVDPPPMIVKHPSGASLQG